MRTLYLDCGMGAAGDMLTASLLQLFSEPVKQVKKLNDLKIPGVKYQLVACTRCGIRGYQVRVFVKGQEEENLHMQTEEHVGHKSEETEKHTQEHGHHSMSQIVRLINRLEIEVHSANNRQPQHQPLHPSSQPHGNGFHPCAGHAPSLPLLQSIYRPQLRPVLPDLQFLTD